MWSGGVVSSRTPLPPQLLLGLWGQIWEVEGYVLECLHDESESAATRSEWQTNDSELETGESPGSVGQPVQTGGRSPAGEEGGGSEVDL